MRVFILLLAFILSGCSSIVKGSQQEVEVQTSGAGCAQCKLSNSKGEYYTNCTPGKIKVKRAYGPLDVNCSGRGIQGKKEVDSHINGWFFGNIFIGGLIGMGVDSLTAAAWDYPETINVQMSQGAAYAPQAAPTSAAGMQRPATSTTTRRTMPRATGSGYSSGYQPLYRPRYPSAAQ
ncbi:MAG: hypothetical protein ACPG80_04090 [Rickettsiales bacterium]